MSHIREILPQANTDGALTLDQLLASAVDEVIPAEDVADLDERIAPTAGRIARTTNDGEIHLADGSEWIPASEVSFGSANNPNEQSWTQDARAGVSNNVDVIAGSFDYPTLQEAIDKAEANQLNGPRRVQLQPGPDSYGRALISKPAMAITGVAQGPTKVDYSGDDHAIEVEDNDVFISQVTSDHTGTGDYDAFFGAATTEGGADNDELQLFQCSCDAAPRYGFNIETPRSHLIGCEGTGGDTAAFRIAGDHTQAIGLKLQEPVAKALVLDADYCTVTANCKFSADTAFDIDGIANSLFLHSRGSGGRGAIITGDLNTGVILSTNSSAEDLSITAAASRNSLWVCTNGNVALSSGTSENVVSGYIGGMLSDTGTRNVVNGVSTNAGDPSSTGEWNGESAKAYRWGARVIDTSTEGDIYWPLPPSATNNWIRVSGSAV